MLSVFASTAAFAGAGASPVVVTNTPAQPVPMVGLITDSDAPARKPFQWDGIMDRYAGAAYSSKITTVPANQRLVIEQASGWCGGRMLGYMIMQEYQSGNQLHHQFLPANFADGNNAPASASVRFYLDPGAELWLYIYNGSNTLKSCDLTLSGYFVNLP